MRSTDRWCLAGLVLQLGALGLMVARLVLR
jgi:hypothetical protein